MKTPVGPLASSSTRLLWLSVLSSFVAAGNLSNISMYLEAEGRFFTLGLSAVLIGCLLGSL